jgi:dTMP kinase
MNNREMFIVLEGPDGSGKTTQRGLLVDLLNNRYKKVIATEEHWKGDETGLRIDRVLNHQEQMDPRELQWLFLKNRVIHTRKLITPALTIGSVVSDRYADSTPAYADERFRYELIEETIRLREQGEILKPDLVLMIDVSPRKCMERIGKGRSATSIFEKEEKLAKVREGYRVTFEKLGENVVWIDGGQDCRKVSEDIKNEVEKLWR